MTDIDKDGGILVKDSLMGGKIRAYPHTCENCGKCKPLYSVNDGLSFLCMRCVTT
jgi:hypothetical protein